MHSSVFRVSLLSRPDQFSVEQQHNKLRANGCYYISKACILQTLTDRAHTCFDAQPASPRMATVGQPHIWKRACSLVSATPDWCDVTRTNITRLFHCLWSSIVSVYYRYQAWQGSDCVLGTCVPSKTNTGSGLICWMISNTAVVFFVVFFLVACWRDGDERVGSSNHLFLQLWSFMFLAAGQINLTSCSSSCRSDSFTVRFLHLISGTNEANAGGFQVLETNSLLKSAIFKLNSILPYCLEVKRLVWGWPFSSAAGLFRADFSSCFRLFTSPVIFHQRPQYFCHPGETFQMMDFLIKSSAVLCRVNVNWAGW